MDTNMILARILYRSDGIFSQLYQDDNSRVCVTLEHSFQFPDTPLGLWEPVIRKGSYICVRGMHRLEGMTEDFETFEVKGIAGHSGVILHWGNWNKDSKACILMGEAIVDSAQGKMVTNSCATFQRFMASQVGIDRFQLTVE
jgi:Family of unknown function (DUF5675)